MLTRLITLKNIFVYNVQQHLLVRWYKFLNNHRSQAGRGEGGRGVISWIWYEKHTSMFMCCKTRDNSLSQPDTLNM